MGNVHRLFLDPPKVKCYHVTNEPPLSPQTKSMRRRSNEPRAPARLLRCDMGSVGVIDIGVIFRVVVEISDGVGFEQSEVRRIDIFNKKNVLLQSFTKECRNYFHKFTRYSTLFVVNLPVDSLQFNHHYFDGSIKIHGDENVCPGNADTSLLSILIF